MKLEHIRYFIKAAQCRSISSAARKLFISQSTLSSVIRSMESELGCELLNRSAKGVELTEKGENALTLMQDICKKYDEILEINSSCSTIKRESVCVCVYPCLCSYLSIELSKLMQSERYSGILLSVKDSLGLDNVINGSADITIDHCEIEEFPYYKHILKNSDYKIEELFEDQVCCYVNTNSALATKDGILPNELSSEHLVISQCCLKQCSISELQEICNHISVLNQPDAVKQAVLDGTFVGIVPGCSLTGNDDTKNGQILRIPFIDTPKKLMVFMIYRKNTSSIEKLILQDIRKILHLS